MDGPTCEIDRLPEVCLSHVLSFTSPCDSCRVAAVSPTFRQAADFDIVWSRFLPPDYLKILSRAVDSVSFSSCKELYFNLCDFVLIDGGKKVYRSTRASWLLYRGGALRSINSNELSPNTTYKSYLIFKLDHEASGVYGLSYWPQDVSVKLGTQICKGKVCVHPDDRYKPSPEVRVPQGRLDGWMEVKLGGFYNEDGSEGDVSMSFEHSKYPSMKCGLIVEGVQVRPK